MNVALLFSTSDATTTSTVRRLRPRNDPRLALVALIAEEDEELPLLVAAVRSVLRI